MKNSWFNISISFIALIIAIVAICCSVDEDVLINDQSIVLGFVGILATFVVVSNYVQMNELGHRTEKLRESIDTVNAKIEEVKNIKDDLYHSNLILALNKIKDSYSKAKTNDEKIKVLKELQVFDGINNSDLLLEVLDFLNYNMVITSKTNVDFIQQVVFIYDYIIYPRINEDAPEIYKLGCEHAYTMIYYSFIKAKKLSFAVYGMFLLKHIYVRGNSDTKKYVLEQIQQIEQTLERTDIGDMTLPIKLIQEYKKDFQNKDLSYPCFSKDICQKLQEEGF